MVETDRPVVRRVAAIGTVLLLHVAVLTVLAGNRMKRPVVSQLVVRFIPAPRTQAVEPPRVITPRLATPPMFTPSVTIELARPATNTAPRTASAMAPGPAGHFGAATVSGLGLEVGRLAGGGAVDRGGLAAFEAAVRRQILAGKQQPVLGWDRRNTCVVGYTVHIDAGGRLSGYSIDPCAVPEINEAARSAIRRAAFPRPPGFGGKDYEVHGSLVFRP